MTRPSRSAPLPDLMQLTSPCAVFICKTRHNQLSDTRQGKKAHSSGANALAAAPLAGGQGRQGGGPALVRGTGRKGRRLPVSALARRGRAARTTIDRLIMCGMGVAGGGD